jgi:hypothetical protein
MIATETFVASNNWPLTQDKLIYKWRGKASRFALRLQKCLTAAAAARDKLLLILAVGQIRHVSDSRVKSDKFKQSLSIKRFVAILLLCKFIFYVVFRAYEHDLSF